MLVSGYWDGSWEIKGLFSCKPALVDLLELKELKNSQVTA